MKNLININHETIALAICEWSTFNNGVSFKGTFDEFLDQSSEYSAADRENLLYSLLGPLNVLPLIYDHTDEQFDDARGLGICSDKRTDFNWFMHMQNFTDVVPEGQGTITHVVSEEDHEFMKEMVALGAKDAIVLPVGTRRVLGNYYTTILDADENEIHIDDWNVVPFEGAAEISYDGWISEKAITRKLDAKVSYSWFDLAECMSDMIIQDGRTWDIGITSIEFDGSTISVGCSS